MASIIHIQREASSRNGKRRLHHIEIRPAKNGGQTVEQHYAQDGGMMYHEPDVYAFRNSQDALDHLATHLGGKPSEEKEEEA